MATRPPVLLCLSRSRNWWAPLVCWLAQVPTNHAFVLYQDERWGGWWALQIGPLGTQLLPAKAVMDEQRRVEAYRYVGGDPWPAMRAVSRYVGEGYDWLGLGWGMVRLAWMRLTGNKLRAWHWGRRAYCFEVLAAMLKHWQLLGGDPADAQPREIRGLLRSRTQFREELVPEEYR